jgi:hypothetical protein
MPHLDFRRLTMRLAEIIDGIVANVAEVDPGNIPDFMADWVPAEEAGPGWAYVEGVFSPPAAPPAPVPEEVSRFQAKAALALAGKLEQADAAVAASGNVVLQLAWTDATVFRRDSPGINALAPAIGLDAVGLDELFRAAAQIVA